MSDSNGALVKVGASAITVREGELGRPGERLAAQLIDGAAYTGVGIAGWITGAAIGLVSTPLGWIAGLSIPLAFIGYQWNLISKEGQTVGKKAMGLKIVDAENGTAPGFVKGVLLRNMVTKALCALPVYPLLNAAPIFWNPRRCLHDYIAGTVVVKDGSQAARGASADPADELDMILEKMAAEMAATRDSLVEAKVALKKAQMKLETLRAESAKLEADAKSAVQRGHDELARKVLHARGLKSEEIAVHEKHLEELKRAVGRLQASVDEMAAKFTQARSKRGTLGTRRALLEAGTAFKNFDDEVGKIQEKVGEQELQMEVQAELAKMNAPQADPLETLPAVDPIDAELEQLRKEMEAKK